MKSCWSGAVHYLDTKNAYLSALNNKDGLHMYVWEWEEGRGKESAAQLEKGVGTEGRERFRQTVGQRRECGERGSKDSERQLGREGSGERGEGKIR